VEKNEEEKIYVIVGGIRAAVFVSGGYVSC
jgi:hypothetical protein